MNQNSPEYPVIFDLLTPGHAAPSANLVAQVFSQDEPLAVAVGQTEAELFAMMSAAAPSALAESLSFGAWVDEELVGAAIATTFTWLPPEGTVALSPSYRPIGALLAQLEADLEARPRPELRACVHIHMLAVDRRFREDRIAGTLVRRCIENATGKNFREAVTDATNPASQRVFARAGFKRINAVRYDNFTFEGERIFSAIPDATDTALMLRAL